MRKIITFFSVFILITMLVGCASRMGKPANVIDANSLSNIETVADHVETHGLGNPDDLVGTTVGPHQGILAKRSFYFDFDSNVVKQKYMPAVKAHAQYLLKHPRARILIEGNTDIRGSREYNIGLGQRRADSLVNIFRMQGVPRQQIRTVSYGAEKPIAVGHTEDDYQMNRRDDIIYEAE